MNALAARHPRASRTLLALVLGQLMPFALAACVSTVTVSRRSGAPGREQTPPRLTTDPAAPHGAKSATRIAAWERRCYAGNADACYNAGVSYEWGKGIKADPERAAELHRRSCEATPPGRHSAKACTNLGYLYAHGRGVPRDDDKAIQFYQRGCDGGNGLGCSNLGVLYEQGRGGVKRDYNRARLLFDSACKAKVALACSNLGLLYKNAKGVKRDRERARRLFDQACTMGASAGCRHAGWAALRDRGGARWRDANKAFTRGCTRARRKSDRSSCHAMARLRGLDHALGGKEASKSLCELKGPYRIRAGRLGYLSDAKAKDAAKRAFATQRSSGNLLARVVFRPNSGPLVALDDGKVRLEAALLSNKFNYPPMFFLRRGRRLSPVLYSAPGLPVKVRGAARGLRAELIGSTIPPLSLPSSTFALTCNELALNRPPAGKLSEWFPGSDSKTLGQRELMRNRKTPMRATPGGKIEAWIKAKSFDVLAVMSTKSKKPKKKPKKKAKRRVPGTRVDLLAVKGSQSKIRLTGYRYAVIGWVPSSRLRPIVKDSLAGVYGLGGLGLAGRGSSTRIVRWSCKRGLPLSVRRPNKTPRKVGWLHPKVRFEVLNAEAEHVPIRIERQRWLKLLGKAELTVPAKLLHQRCKDGR